MNAIEKSLSILGLDPEATPEEINQAYRDLAMVWHPDRFPNDSRVRRRAEETLKKVNEAYQVLQRCDRASNSRADSGGARSGHSRQSQDHEGANEPQPARLQIRPWIRFWARLFDIQLFGLIAGLVVGMTVPTGINEAFFSGSERKIWFGMACIFAWVFVEAFLLSSFGTTPGKWLFKIKLIPQSGTISTFPGALKRSIAVWWRGLGTGFPVASLFTACIAYDRLMKNGVTSWDRDAGFTVVNERMGFAGGFLALACFLAPITVVSWNGVIRAQAQTGSYVAPGHTSFDELLVSIPEAQGWQVRNEAPSRNPPSAVDYTFVPIASVAERPIDATFKPLQKDKYVPIDAASTPMAKAAADFLDAAVKGDTKRAIGRLTPQGIQRILSSGKKFSLPGLKMATVKVSEVRAPSNDKAIVKCVLTDSSKGTLHNEEICCLLRKVENDWRILGIAHSTTSEKSWTLTDFESGQNIALPRESIGGMPTFPPTAVVTPPVRPVSFKSPNQEHVWRSTSGVAD